MLLVYYFHYRTFTDPSPPEREVLNAVSSLSSNIISSLKLIHRFSFNVFVRRDVLNFLLSNCGNRKRGKMYNRCDFSDKYFKDSDFMYTNNHNESIRLFVCIVLLCVNFIFLKH